MYNLTEKQNEKLVKASDKILEGIRELEELKAELFAQLKIHERDAVEKQLLKLLQR